MGNSNGKQHVRIAEIEANAKVEIERRKLESEKLANDFQVQIHDIDQRATNQKIEAEYVHQRALEEIADQRRANEAQHELQLKKLDIEKGRVEDEGKLNLEKVEVEKQKIDTDFKKEIALIEERKEARRDVNILLKDLLDRKLPITEFAYAAIVGGSVLRNEKPDLNALQLVGEHTKMLEEVRLGIEFTEASNNPRRHALAESQMVIGEDEAGKENDFCNAIAK